MKTSPQLRGHAGEMFVCAELMRRGWIAGLTARGSRAFDIIARRDNAHVFVSIRVKTGHLHCFGWNCKEDGTLFIDMGDSGDFTIIVDLPEPGSSDSPGSEAPDYYIIPTPKLEKILQDNHSDWLKRPGRKGRAHRDGPMRRIWVDDDGSKASHGYAVTMKPYKNAWSLLEGRD
jgi:hypothetical protein